MKIVFIDVDHTVIRHSTAKFFITHAIRRRLLPRKILLYYPYYYMKYRLGQLGADLFPPNFPELEGLGREDLVSCAAECLDIYLKKDISPDARRLIEEEKEKENTVVFASSSLDFFIQPLADYLAVDYMTSILEFSDGVCTGRIVGRLNFGEEKERRATAYATAKGIALRDCSFYSDSYHDLPLLQTVGQPVAVNPDIRLKREAKRRGWDIRYFRGGKI
jgi:HAD superfamily hydrolase (TIGR01490 family)